MPAPDIRLAKLDTDADADANPNAAARCNIRGISTLIVFRNGREMARQAGATDSTALTRWIREQV